MTGRAWVLLVIAQPRAPARGYRRSSACGGLSRRCRWLGWIAEGITYSTHAHRCRSQAEACHRLSALIDGRIGVSGVGYFPIKSPWRRVQFKLAGSDVHPARTSPPNGGRHNRDSSYPEAAEGEAHPARTSPPEANSIRHKQSRRRRGTSGTNEPAGGGRPPVAPCKRSAERSDARSAAWGWHPSQSREPAERRANERLTSDH